MRDFKRKKENKSNNYNKNSFINQTKTKQVKNNSK